MWILPVVAPALTFVFIFIIVFPFFEKLRLIAASAAAYLRSMASARTSRTRLDSGLDLQTLRHRLVVVLTTIRRITTVTFTSLHIRFDLQSTRHGLVVLLRIGVDC